MDQHVNQLTEILARELQLHETLIQSAQAVNVAIKESSVEELQQRTAHYDEQVVKLGKLEDERSECCAAVASELGIAVSALRIQAIIDRLPQERRIRIEQLRTALKQKVADLTKVNTSNRILLEESLGMIEHTFSSVRKSVNRPSGYGQKGAHAYAKAGSALVNRVI